MSEYEAVSIPAAVTNMASTNGFRELLGLNLGRRVIAEFLVGLDETAVKTGTLYAVQPEYFVLQDDYGNYVAADIFSLKFLTFCPNCVPAVNEPVPAQSSEVRQSIEEPPITELPTWEGAGEAPSAGNQPVSPQASSSTVRISTPASLAALNYTKRKTRRLD